MRHWVAWLGLLCLCAVSPARAQDLGMWPDLMKDGPVVGGGQKDAAVIVGVEDYLFVPDVPGAASNALAWSRYLQRSRQVPLSKIALLTNKDGTREKIERALEQAREDVGAGGTIWFVFIGHGAPSRDGRDGVMVGADADQDPSSIYARSVSREALLKGLEQGRQGHTNVILDTCFSGRDSQNNAVASGLQPLVPRKGGDQPRKKITVFTAGQGDQFAGPLPGAQRPAFSYLMLGALWGWGDEDGDGAVTEQEARDYVAGNLRFLLQGKRAQTPEIWSSDPARALVKGQALVVGPDIYQVASSLVGGVGDVGKPSKSNGNFDVGSLESEVVVFSSEPPGATVLLDGEVLCQETPCSRSVEPGSHRVEMSGDCFERASAQAQIKKGEAGKVHLALKERPAGIEVRVSDGRGNALKARVFVDGRELGSSPDRFPVGVCARQLTITLEGYEGWSSPLQLTERQVSKFSVTLKEDRALRAQQDGMVRVPGGEFTMGASLNAREQPVRRVWVDEFFVDRLETTVDEYAQCVRAGACQPPRKDVKDGTSYNWNNQGREKHPINGVDWEQARVYCAWKGKRLPTEAEWEKAARGTDSREFPWGSQQPSCGVAQTKGCTGNTAPVGSFPGGASPYGAQDMAGNVWEWVSDWYEENAYQSQPARNPRGPSSGTKRGLRGGSWGIDHVFLRSAHRNAITPAHSGNDLGIRCAK